MKKFESVQKMLNYIDLDSDLDDFEKIHENIEKEIIFKGTNLWILVFAIIVASVGLNMNSTAVIIGAMLISPLMGPINGMGYSIATYNFPLFRKAVKNLSFAVIGSLIASTAYFAVSPISTAHSELLARTSPTIYDVIIALFGGLAGIVAISSKHKGNVIPGVAIATALMPPLCTAGYGLATGQFNYFFGAFYLFTINTVFIAISSVVISQILKFPIRTLVDSQQKKKVNQLISVIITLVLLPSIYFGYNLVKQEKFIENANKYINSISIVDGHYLLKNEVRPIKKEIVLFYAGTSLSEEQKERIRGKAKLFSLNEVSIEFPQGLSTDEISKKNTEGENIKAEINRLLLLVKDKEKQIDSLDTVKYRGKEILGEIKNLYPQITNCAYSESYVFNSNASVTDTVAIIVFSTQAKGSDLIMSDKSKIENWLQARLNSEKIKVFYE
jgi:uncharacterized hydrophobic protein (TIGR00271 family)